MASEIDKNFDLAKLALKRNDEAIRFSDTKATIMLTVVSLAFTVLIDKSQFIYQNLYHLEPLPKILCLVAFVMLLIGILIITISTLFVVFPRMKSSTKTGVLYFGDYLGRKEKDDVDFFLGMSQEEGIKQLVSEIHITSEIANRKFIGIRIATVGTAIVILSLFFAYFALIVL